MSAKEGCGIDIRPLLLLEKKTTECLENFLNMIRVTGLHTHAPRIHTCDGHRRMFGAQTMERLSTFIMVTSELSGRANFCAEMWRVYGKTMRATFVVVFAFITFLLLSPPSVRENCLHVGTLMHFVLPSFSSSII